MSRQLLFCAEADNYFIDTDNYNSSQQDRRIPDDIIQISINRLRFKFDVLYHWAKAYDPV